MRSNRKEGFTLIELLVVIAIIAILAAVLFPVFVSAKNKGHQAKCMSNLRQLASGFMLYLQDSGDVWPTLYWSPYYKGGDWYPWTPNPNRDDGWVDFVNPYIKNRKGVYLCPSNRNWKWPDGSTHTFVVTNYLYNFWLGATKIDLGNGHAQHPNAGRSQSEIRNTSRTIALHDGSMWDWGRTFSPMANGECLPAGADASRAGTNTQIQVVHMEGGNFIWCDGHVSWLDLKRWTPNLWCPSPPFEK